ncbi:hypothetical protein F2Q69_00028893 [Brassica cretica]|uniref:Uncharacterized protein n=1 Tax=Brassica cretica TaxID=69181 RepID=A0A8S9RZU5_BRACR|nr:hypothetical protein F2Q69_00028893 [Brassica cretica]
MNQRCFLSQPLVQPKSTVRIMGKDHGLIVSAHHENVLNPIISKGKHIFTWLKNVLLKPFYEEFYLSCALKEIWCRKMHEPKLLRPKNQFDFIYDEKFSDLAFSLSFPNRFTVWPNFKIDKPIFGDQFTCLMLAHVLDDYPKNLDPVFDVLMIEKPFEYRFIRFDVVSLVVLDEQDKHDHFPRRASNDGRQRTWNYLMKKTLKLQGSTMVLRTNPFEEGEYDAPQYMDQYMKPDQDGDQDDQIIPTEVQAADRPRQTDRAVYRIDPPAAGEELRLEPRPDDRTHRTGARLPRPTRPAKTDGRARTHFDRVETETDHCLSLLVRLIRAECPDERTDGSAGQYDQFLNFDDQNFSKARILQLSKDLGRTGTKMMHGPYPADYPKGASPVLNFSSFLGVVSSKQTPLSVGLVSHIKQRFKIASLLDRFGRAIRIQEEVFHACDLRNFAGEELRSKACAENLAVHSGMTSGLVELAVGIILELVPGPGISGSLSLFGVDSVIMFALEIFSFVVDIPVVTRVFPSRGRLLRVVWSLPRRNHLVQTNLDLQANALVRWSCESYQATVQDRLFVGPVSHIRQQSGSGRSPHSIRSPLGVHIFSNPVE